MLADVITSLGGGALTVTRTAVGSLSQGRYTPGATSNIGIVALIQPISGRDLRALPDGLHASDVRALFTTTPLKNLDPTTGAGDTVAIAGETYRVFNVEGPWTLGGSTHYRVLVARQVVP